MIGHVLDKDLLRNRRPASNAPQTLLLARLRLNKGTARTAWWGWGS